ncbi:hypothetical protein HHX47_DHR2000935 [Lentinula edodes]|nr:hypothetical protein HHX47_DHR2000935 [Lentinula edodes]
MNDAAPESTLPYPPIHKDKKFVVLSDWDGTITTDGFREMLASVVANGHSFEECKEILRKNIKLDPGFKEFYAWCKANDIPVIIVSSGMTPTIRAVLTNLVGEESANEIEIISNDVELRPDGTWGIKFRHPTRRVKMLLITYLAEQSFAYLVVSAMTNLKPFYPIAIWNTLQHYFSLEMAYQVNMSAAKHADVLFVKEKEYGENDLAAYCTKLGIKHILFKDFSNALPIVQSVVKGEKTVQEALNIGHA